MGIFLDSGVLPSSIDYASPARRRSQSDGTRMPSASRTSQSLSTGTSLLLAGSLKITMPSSTSSNSQ